MLRLSSLRKYSFATNPFNHVKKELKVEGKNFSYYSLPALGDKRVEKLPFSIRVLLESAVRNCDEFEVKSQDVESILSWESSCKVDVDIPFKPARVLLQDFTGVPCIVDLAAMRDTFKKLGQDPKNVNPLCPVDLVIDHSVQADVARVKGAFEKNEEIEFQRNIERFEFLKWGQSAFNHLLIVPPGSGIVHQVNLEYLARVVFNKDGVLYPDSLVGTDSHTTMINGLGVTGWGVGGIEAESVMLGQSISMTLPKVVGFKLEGSLKPHVTATDLVLTITEILRKKGVVGKFVEYYGPGIESLSLPDRATIANMSPEYGATMGFFPVDVRTLEYLKETGRTPEQINTIESYLRAQNMFKLYDGSQSDPVFTDSELSLNLSEVEPCVSGPKRPQDKILLKDLKSDFNFCLTNKSGFKGFGLDKSKVGNSVDINLNGEKTTLKNGSVVIAAITSCTNTSNPESIILAALLAKKAMEKGMKVPPFVKTTLSPGSKVVTEYLDSTGLTEAFNYLGFYTAGYGCMTCIGNSGELEQPVLDAITKENLAVCAVLSGNRNFEARVHPLTKGNYLASPALVVAYALAGNVDVDLQNEPIGQDSNGNDVFFADIWPSREESSSVLKKFMNSNMYSSVYDKISQGTARWNALEVKKSDLYSWKDSTYIHEPPFFKDFSLSLPKVSNIENAHCLAVLGDSITTDHISPAGRIAKNSPAGRFLVSKGVSQEDFNSYGSRRGNDLVMARGTFANTLLSNKMLDKVGPQTIHVPSGEILDIFDAAEKYQSANIPTIILAGAEYGSGSSRDWAAKGPYLQGVKAVIAQSFERIHRSNLIGMGILPLQFLEGQSVDSLGLTGKEQFNIDTQGGNLKVGDSITVSTSNGKSFQAKIRLDTEVEVEYFKNGGILHYVLRKMAAN